MCRQLTPNTSAITLGAVIIVTINIYPSKCRRQWPVISDFPPFAFENEERFMKYMQEILHHFLEI